MDPAATPLAETLVGFPKALKIAQAMESADRDAQHLQALQSDKVAPVTEVAVHNASSDTNRDGAG